MKCPKCNGIGHFDTRGESRFCQRCNGTGIVPDVVDTRPIVNVEAPAVSVTAPAGKDGKDASIDSVYPVGVIIDSTADFIPSTMPCSLKKIGTVKVTTEEGATSSVTKWERVG